MMGHAHSKKKRHKYNRELADYINRNVPGCHDNKDLNRYSLDVDRLSHCSEPFIQSSTLPKIKPRWKTMPITHDAPSREDSPLLKAAHISYKDIKIDDHPALTKLQNEQNTRLEKMEERMNKIRLHAMQEADRRKYAYLFKAKTRQSPTKELLFKAKEKILQKQNICDEKENQRQPSDIHCEDKGEIIPVTVVKDSMKKSEKEMQKSNKLQRIPAFDSINLSKSMHTYMYVHDVYLQYSQFIFILFFLVEG
jgi:hypothetical protein